MSTVYRIFTEKRPGFALEAQAVLDDLRVNLHIVPSALRIFHRYDVEGIDRATYERARPIVFSEPPCDDCYDEQLPELDARLLCVEALPGQFDQRADSCAQCIQMLAGGERPTVRYAKVYAFVGGLADAEFERMRNYLINPVDSREASPDKPATLLQIFAPPEPPPLIEGFIAAGYERLESIHGEFGLAMDIDDLEFLRDYFAREGRDPTVTELRCVDTYWSDHCRHTTFLTRLDDVAIEDEHVLPVWQSYLDARLELYGDKAGIRPVTLMDIGTCAGKLLKARGQLPMLDLSDEINACSIKTTAMVDGKQADYLLMFKNETHNHPTEIEPFGGAATCIGGAIRDPLAGRAYVYQAMRVTGACDPRVPVEDTISGKLPAKKLTVTAAEGFSSYGNQIGLATGLVTELYHEGYRAKRMECGAVVGAVPAAHVVRETPRPGDVVLLIGGRTGRDGCGGATGSSKTHTSQSVAQCAAEVQKGNAPEERKIQRLFRNPDVARMIRRCNDFGAGGVAVAIGELADGLRIWLDRIPLKYDGLSPTELAISESQERMAVVVAAGDARRVIDAALSENLEATLVAEVTAEPRLRMEWNGGLYVDLAREFLNTNGAERRAAVRVTKPVTHAVDKVAAPMDELSAALKDINFCSQKGLTERFDGTVGAGSLLMPHGGETQRTPAQVMAALLPVDGETSDCSVMSFGFDPDISAADPFYGAACAVVQSVSRLVAAGCATDKVHLSFQEYFERLGADPVRWGKPFAALLGAFAAQMGLGIAAIGGKDSMSGSFNDIDVPPTLVSFAVTPERSDALRSPEFKGAGHPVYLLLAPELSGGLPDFAGLSAMWARVRDLYDNGAALSGWAVERGGAAGGVFKMCLGNSVGFDGVRWPERASGAGCGSIILECTREIDGALLLGYTAGEPLITLGRDSAPLEAFASQWAAGLEGVFPTCDGCDAAAVPAINCGERHDGAPAIRAARPRAVVTVFPGTNCEYDTERALVRAGALPHSIVVRNLTSGLLEQSARELERAIRGANMLVIPGGFSGGDEPEGSGKFIASLLREAGIADAIRDLLHVRGGLVLGICNGFQALVKLGLLPYGDITPMELRSPTLTYNSIGRHQSLYVTTRVASVRSPWLSLCEPGELHAVPVSNGEGRFVAPQAVIGGLVQNGQVAFQYCDAAGVPTMDIRHNPSGSMMAVEGITSPDGRVLGKMGHSERRGAELAKNIPGNKFQPLFEGGVRYFK